MASAVTTELSVARAVFKRQIRGLGRPGDVLIAISATRPLAEHPARHAAARQQGLTIVGLTGRTGGEMTTLCDLCLRQRNRDDGRGIVVEAAHQLAGDYCASAVLPPIAGEEQLAAFR